MIEIAGAFIGGMFAGAILTLAGCAIWLTVQVAKLERIK